MAQNNSELKISSLSEAILASIEKGNWASISYPTASEADIECLKLLAEGTDGFSHDSTSYKLNYWGHTAKGKWAVSVTQPLAKMPVWLRELVAPFYPALQGKQHGN